MTTDGSRHFEMELEIRASRSDVWNAIASAEGLQRWFPAGARFEPGLGGEVVWSWGDAYRWPQKIDAWEPGRRLRTRYDSTVDDGEGGKRPLYVDFILEGDGGTTTVRLVHSGFGPEADFDDEYDGISSGWPCELRSLRHVLENHPSSPRRLVWDRIAVPLSTEEAWRRLTGPDGFECGEDVGSLDEGEAFSLRLTEGRTLDCRALVGGPRTLSGTVPELGEAFLRITAESCTLDQGDEIDVWIWLATYDLDEARLAVARRDLDAVVERAFAGVPMRALDTDEVAS